MPSPIKLSIDLRLIDQSRCKKTTRKNGDAATFCDIVLWPTENDQYGNDYRVVQDLGKEARDAGEKGAILGNGRNFGQSAKPPASKAQKPPPQRKPPVDPDLDATDDGVPF